MYPALAGAHIVNVLNWSLGIDVVTGVSYSSIPSILIPSSVMSNLIASPTSAILSTSDMKVAASIVMLFSGSILGIGGAFSHSMGLTFHVVFFSFISISPSEMLRVAESFFSLFRTVSKSFTSIKMSSSAA